MIRRLSAHAVPLAVILSILAFAAAAVFAGAVYFRKAQGGFAVTVPLAGGEAAQIQVQPPTPTSTKPPGFGSWPALANPNFFEQVKDRFIAEKTSFIEADLTAMTVSVYQNGEVVKQVPILTIGRPGSWWETPAGLYKAEVKKENHFSSFGKVYQPWSIVFQGNFFIHGWPYYPDGTPVDSSFSGGCIRLSTEDAKAVYDLVKTGMPVLVYEQEFKSDDFRYPVPTAGNVSTLEGITAKEYLAADLKNNYVLLAQDSAVQAPIASIAKLMTALIAAEYINLDANITIPAAAVVSTSNPRFKEGDKITAYQLLYPLLAESSNEAAVALASRLGQKRFVELMNQKAAALGMANTRFTDSSGKDSGNVSTTEDLFALAKYLLNNRSFILKISSDTVGWNVYGASQFDDLENYNIFTGEPEFIGGKVGKTIAAGQTNISLFTEKLQGQERPIVIVALGSANNAADSRAILEFVRANYH